MRRFARRLGWALCAFVLAISAAIVLGILVPRPGVTRSDPAAAGEGRHRILVLSNPIHTDIALPADAAVRARFAFLADAGLPIGRPEVGSIIVGWGGRSFYLETPTWADVKLGPVLKGLTSDSSVLHVGLAGPLDTAAEGVTAIDLDGAAFERLLRFMEKTLSRDAAGRPILIPGAGYGPFDAFFEAEGRFNALLGCNDWTGRALAEAGIGVGAFTPLPTFLLWSLDLHG